MDDPQRSDFLQVSQTENSQFKARDAVQKFIADRVSLHRDSLIQQHLRTLRLRRSHEELKLRKGLQDRLIETLGAREDVERLRELARARLVPILDLPLLDPHVPKPPSGVWVDPNLPTPPNIGSVGEMWWAYTNIFYPMEYASAWFDSDGDHVAANIPSSDGDLKKYSIRILAHFELSADRMPSGNQFYLTNPVSEVIGKVYGFTLSPALFDFGDHWAKCWFTTRQTLFVFPPPATTNGLIATMAVGTTASESRNLFFIEDGYPDIKALPGLLAMPPLRFFLPANTFSVVSELEWEFQIQLEGDGAGVWVGHLDGAPSCIVRHPQWTIRPG